MAIYARFERDGRRAYGLVDGSRIAELAGGLFDPPERTTHHFALNEVKLLAPCEPANILAVGLNYKSHLAGRKLPVNPEIFFKPVSCLQNPDDPILTPPGATDLHMEGELAIIIGRHVRNATPEEAAEAVFGVTCGNDVSEREWQRGPNADRQWWRAKGSDTFGPLGPWIVTGLNYSDLALETRLNGELVQSQRTSDLIFDVPNTISFASRYVTLQPGDVIYTGTPGNTRAMKPGDVVEIEIEGIGVLRNPIQ